MTPDGRFREPPPRPAAMLPAQVIGVAALVAIVAGAVALALLALWLALTLIPVAIGAALIGYGVFRFQVWRARHTALGRGRSLRP